LKAWGWDGHMVLKVPPGNCPPFTWHILPCILHLISIILDATNCVSSMRVMEQYYCMLVSFPFFFKSTGSAYVLLPFSFKYKNYSLGGWCNYICSLWGRCNEVTVILSWICQILNYRKHLTCWNLYTSLCRHLFVHLEQHVYSLFPFIVFVLYIARWKQNHLATKCNLRIWFWQRERKVASTSIIQIKES
jgi:hypothetical protein